MDPTDQNPDGATPPLLAPQTLARLERLVALARRVVPRRRRRRLLKRPGRGIEPGARRDYVPGDDPRMMDWPAYARLERLLVKVQEDLPEPRLDLVLDGSGSMGHGHPTPGSRAALAAAALAACAVAREVQVVVWWASARSARLELRRPGELVRLLRFLAERRPEGPSALISTAERLSGAARIRGGAIVLSDGLDDDVAGAARRLKTHGFDVLVVVAAAAAELPPALAAAADASGLVELVDAETGARRQIPCSRLVLEHAARARAQSGLELGARLDEVGVAIEPLRAEAPFEAVALGLLRG